ncbi:MAG: GAF domain-containing protein [Legionellaceae bacterium]|nr:GAF domain-containing protein [Legionellaceae bacterium]
MSKKRPAGESDRLAALYELKILDTPPEERFDRIVRLASRYLSAPIAYIALLDTDRQWFKASCGLQAKQTPRNISFCNHTIQQAHPLVVPDARQDERFANSPLVTNAPNIRFYAGFPLSTAEGFKVGTLCISDTSPRQLQPEQLSILKDLADLAEDQLTLLDIYEMEKKIRDKNASLQKAKKALELRNDFIRKTFSCFMSDDVVNELLKPRSKLKLGGEQRKITILFSDLRNFTPLSEQYPAEKIVAALNNYFGHMVSIIESYNGTIDSFIGDAIMVLFGAPFSDGKEAERAIACALAMQQNMEEVNRYNRKNKLPELNMGIGINTGQAIIGNIGSEKRMQYSAIGSPVNLAARIQDLSLGGQVLISEATRQEVDGLLQTSGHLRVKVKGVDTPITIYDVASLNQ